MKKNNSIPNNPFINPKVVKKGWGQEIVLVNDEKYCGKILQLKKDSEMSMHYHMIKDETWYIIRGSYIFKFIDTKTADVYESKIEPGVIIRIKPGFLHQIICVEEGEILEISTQHFENDSYRVWKGDSQKSGSTEPSM